MERLRGYDKWSTLYKQYFRELKQLVYAFGRTRAPNGLEVNLKMREKLGVNTAKIALQGFGAGISAPKKRKFSKTGERLKTLCSRLVIDEISVEEFLINIGNCIRFENEI